MNLSQTGENKKRENENEIWPQIVGNKPPWVGVEGLCSNGPQLSTSCTQSFSDTLSTLWPW
jgi:hypothetical protein